MGDQDPGPLSGGKGRGGEARPDAGEKEPSATLTFHLPPPAPGYLAAGRAGAASAQARPRPAPGGARPFCDSRGRSARLATPGRGTEESHIPSSNSPCRRAVAPARAKGVGLAHPTVPRGGGTEARRTRNGARQARALGPLPGLCQRGPLGHLVTARGAELWVGRPAPGRGHRRTGLPGGEAWGLWELAHEVFSPLPSLIAHSPILSPPPTFILIPEASRATVATEPTWGGEIRKFPATNSLLFFFPSSLFLARAESNGGVGV